MESALVIPWNEPLRRLVFDLSGVTCMDLAALTTLLRADQRGRREGFEVVVVRPPALATRVLSLRAGEHLKLVEHPSEAGVPDQYAGRVGSEARETAIEFRRLPSEEVFTCVRCRSNPAVFETAQAVAGLTLVSPDGPICGGCVTKQERLEMGEAILGDLRRSQARQEASIGELEKALAELRDSTPAD